MDEEITLNKDPLEEEIISSPGIKIRTERVLVKCVDGTLINGDTNMGRCRRISEVFTKGEDPFVVIFNANVQGYTGDVVFVNREHIVWAMPLDEESTVI
jgi:hypothetical protein